MLVWLKRIWHWLGQANVVWKTLGVVIAAICICFVGASSEQKIRLVGLGLQLLGVGTAAWGIRSTRIFFRHKSLFERIRSGLAAFPKPLSREVHLAGASSTAVFSDVAVTNVWHGSGANPTPESRLEAAEKNLKTINERLNIFEVELENKIQEFTSSLKRESEQRSSDSQSVLGKLESVTAGGLDVAAAGIVILVIGLVFSTASPEIQGFLR